MEMNYNFSYFKLNLASRLAISGLLFIAGAMLALFFPRISLIGAAIIVAGYVPLVLKTITNKPADEGLEQWRPVAVADVDKLSDAFIAAKKIKAKAIGSAVTTIMPLFLSVFVCLFFWGINRSIAFFVGLALLFLVPALLFGRAKIFVPAEFDLKMPCFQAILSESCPDDICSTPYIRFDKDAAGKDIPEDLRVLIEPKRKPEDLTGIQFQVAINNGPNGSVPYMYAVILTKGKGSSYRNASHISAAGYEVEEGGDDEHGAVIVRQKTSGTGYYTRPEDCVRLFSLSVKLLRKLTDA